MAHSTYQSALDREDVAHPEKSYKDIFFIGGGPISADDREKLAKSKLMGSVRREELSTELCWSCGWTVENEILSSYGSRIRIMYTSVNLGIWEIGSSWLIRDRPNDGSMGSDYITQEFLRNHHSHLKIPLIKEMRKLSAPTDKVDLTLMSRAEGVGLNTIWDRLSRKQKANYQHQLGGAMRSWRQLTSPIPKNVDGSLPADCIITDYSSYRKIGRTTEEWLGTLEEELKFGISCSYRTKDPVEIERIYQKMKREFPSSEPYVLTHGDLNFTNIIVKEGKIEAIIDWERAAFLPWWAERWLSRRIPYPNTVQLFHPLWEDLDEQMDEETFSKKVDSKVAPFADSWFRSLLKTMRHPNPDARWQRPTFCECKPYAGAFHLRHIGNELERRGARLDG